MRAKSPTTRKPKRGFTLLEIAIVLGIIGLLTATIFAVASIAQRRLKINQASDELHQIVVNAHNFFGGQYVKQSGAYALIPSDADYATYTPTFIKNGIFPYEMLTKDSSTTPATFRANTPFAKAGACANSGNGTVQASYGQTKTSGGLPVQLVIIYRCLDSETCADMLVHNSIPGSDTSLTKILVNGIPQGIFDGTGGNALPINSAKAQNVCSPPSGTAPTTADVYDIEWFFNING